MYASISFRKGSAPLLFRNGLLALLALCLGLVNGRAQTGRKQYLLALSKKDHLLVTLDASSLKVLGKVPVGQDPHEVVASADGKLAYVSIYGGGRFHEINVIDLVNQKALPTIDTRPLFGPHGLMYWAGKVWFSAEGSKAIGSYDPATSSLDWSMGTGQDRTHMIYVTANQKKIYTTNVASGTVSYLELKAGGFGGPPMGPPPGAAPQGNNPPPGNPPPGMGGPMLTWVQTVIPVSRGCEGFDVSPDGKEIWTVSSDDGRIFIIDTATRKVGATVDAKAMGANRLKFTPDGKRVFISSLRDGQIYIYDAATRTEIKRLAMGKGCAGIQMDPDGSRVFIACSGGNFVAVIDLKTLEVTSRLDVGGEPDGLAWAIR